MSPIALVTGASRGIGRATALALAGAGFDVALTARTLREGTGRDNSDSGAGREIPGSLESTAQEVEARGRRALPVVADLLDWPSLEAAVAQTLTKFERIDVLVNNAVDTGPGSMLRFADTTLEQFETKVRANFLAQIVLIKAVMPSMVAAGGGLIVNVTSPAGVTDPPAPAGNGGWGLAYAASKGAFHRVAGVLAVEYGDAGVVAINLDPGTVLTERMAVNQRALGLEAYPAAPPTVPAAVIAWLATSSEAASYNGQTIAAQRFALKNGLHPDWRA